MRLLDLFCCEGVGAWGYWLSSRFSEIVGIDIDNENRDRYSFDFICGDALKLDYDFLSQFDLIHASPPCQGYSKATPDQSKHMRLVAATHLMLYASGKPYVIENVEGSGQELRPNLVMNGHAFGLPMNRRRYFHVSTLGKPERKIRSGLFTYDLHGGSLSRAQMIEAMGLSVISRTRLNLITRRGIKQGIPPAMTQYIAERMVPNKYRVG